MLKNILIFSLTFAISGSLVFGQGLNSYNGFGGFLGGLFSNILFGNQAPVPTAPVPTAPVLDNWLFRSGGINGLNAERNNNWQTGACPNGDQYSYRTGNNGNTTCVNKATSKNVLIYAEGLAFLQEKRGVADAKEACSRAVCGLSCSQKKQDGEVCQIGDECQGGYCWACSGFINIKHCASGPQPNFCRLLQ